jgi:transcriptional regulator with XRE-family HTH domain|tara:strand:+ start:875 stop:1201 length:327 start_codon:yes stop_codon:yes gene_type:complete
VNPIKSLRLAADLNGTELAKRAGSSQGTIWKVETGHRLPSLKLLVSLSYALKLTDAQAGELARALIAESGLLKAESGLTVLVGLSDVMQLTDAQAGKLARALIKNGDE